MTSICVDTSEDQSTCECMFTLDVRKEHLTAWNYPVYRGFVVEKGDRDAHDSLHKLIFSLLC